MANQFLTPKVYANTMLVLLKNKLVLGKKVNTEFKDEFKQKGQTIYVKRPPEFLVTSGPNINVQDVVEGEMPVVLNQQNHVDIAISSIDDTLTVTQLLRDKTMDSAATTLAQSVESAIAAQCINFPQWVGTPGTLINNQTSFFRIPQRLDELAVPMNSRNAFISPADGYALAGAFTSLYAQKDIATDALTKAKIPMMGNVDPYIGQSVATLTTGTRSSTGATINGAAQDVSYASVKSGYTQTLNLTGLTSGQTIAAGDTFTIAGVFAVNPRTKAPLPYLMQFVSITAATVAAGGTVTLTIRNPIIISGAYQNVTASPANGAAVTFVGSPSTNYPQNMAFHEQAISLAYAKLTKPKTGECEYATDPDSGVSIRYWQASDITTDNHYHRWDILFGVSTVDSRLGTRASG